MIIVIETKHSKMYEVVIPEDRTHTVTPCLFISFSVPYRGTECSGLVPGFFVILP